MNSLNIDDGRRFWPRKASARSTKSPMSSRASWIEGFDDDTAAEIQARAQGHIKSEFDDQRKALGCPTISRMTTPMLVKLGENGVKTLEDLADCAR